MPDHAPFNLRDVPPAPWKNAAGSTRELHCQPPGSAVDDVLWRVSVADVDTDAPFSTFAGIERSITLLHGDGLHLQFDDGEAHALTTPFAPFTFAGERPLHATVPGAATQDFNLMVRRSGATGHVTVHREGEPMTLAASTRLLFIAQGEATLLSPGAAPLNLSPLDCLPLPAGHAGPVLHCGPRSVVLAVHIEAARPATVPVEPMPRCL